MDGRNALELYWVVDDVEAAYRELPKNADIVLRLTEKPFGKVFSVKGPSGEPRYMLQFSAKRPSMAVG